MYTLDVDIRSFNVMKVAFLYKQETINNYNAHLAKMTNNNEF